MKGKYLITTDAWFVAPDGKTYNSVWGEVRVFGDEILGIKTNRNASNWYAQIGSDDNHIIVAGCQIHYAVKCENKPNTKKIKDWQVDATNYHEYTRPTKIYIAD